MCIQYYENIKNDLSTWKMFKTLHLKAGNKTAHIYMKHAS